MAWPISTLSHVTGLPWPIDLIEKKSKFAFFVVKSWLSRETCLY